MVLHDEETIELTTPKGPMRTYVFRPKAAGSFPGILFYSEIFQLTGPIRRMSAFLAGHGFVVAVPEIYHELEPAGSVIGYDPESSARGNAHKTTKELASYDADARAVLDFLGTHPACTGRIGTMGVCIGGHLSFRAAMNPDVLAAACFYATDIHIGGLGQGRNDDSLARAGDIKGDLLMIWGRQDPHVPLEGRNRIHARLEEVAANFQWLEVNGAHAFMRDEGPRYDPALWRECFNLVLELFHQRLI
jgi:carboxymethylenebutenolidase